MDLIAAPTPARRTTTRRSAGLSLSDGTTSSSINMHHPHPHELQRSHASDRRLGGRRLSLPPAASTSSRPSSLSSCSASSRMIMKHSVGHQPRCLRCDADHEPEMNEDDEDEDHQEEGYRLLPISGPDSEADRHHLLALGGGWLLHATRLVDGSLRLRVQHDACRPAVTQVVTTSNNEVVFRCEELRNSPSWPTRESRSFSAPNSTHTSAEWEALEEVEELADGSHLAIPETKNRTGGVDADVARSVVSTLLTSLTTDDLDKPMRRNRAYTDTSAFSAIVKKRRLAAMNEVDEHGNEHASTNSDSKLEPITKRRRRNRAEGVRRATMPIASTSSTSPTFSDMPAEIQLSILQLVPMLELLRTVPLVSHQWNSLSRDDGLWRTLKLQYFGSMLPHDRNLSLAPTYRDQCIGLLRELKLLQNQHHRRLFDEERSYRQSQLIWGCSGGHKTFVSDLFRYHSALIDVDMLSASGNHAERTPLMVAVAAGNDEVASLLLIERKADVNRATTDGSTPLMIAASKGHQNAVAFLLDHGAEVNRITKNGCSALMLAALAGHDQIAKVLLERGADPCGKTIDGSTALMIAVSKGNKQIVHSLLEFMPANQRISVVNEARKDGWTALMIASTKGEEDLVRSLVKSGADVNRRKTGDGCTALMFAAAKGYANIVRYLLLNNADANIRNRDGWSALMIAADWGHKSCVEVFIENKELFVNNGNPFGRVNLRMALIVAFMKKYYDIFTILLQVGPPQ